VPISDPNLQLSTLVVSGATTSGTLAASGAATVGSLAVSGSSVLAGALIVNASADITGIMTVGALGVTNSSVLTGPLTVNNTAAITGATTVGSLAVSGGSVLTGPMTVNNTAAITGATTVGSLAVTGGSVMTGPMTVNNTANITGATSVGPLTVTGQTTANGALVVNSTANITGATTVSSLTMTGPTVANGTLVVNNTANVTGATTLGSLAVTNNSVLTGTLRVNNSATVTGATTLGSLTVNGGSVLGGAVTFNNGFTSANGANFGSTTNISNLNVTNNATVQNNLTVRLIELGPLSNQTVIQQAQITMKNFQTNQLIGQVNVSNFSGDTLILSNFAQVNTAVNTPLISSMALRISSINGLPPNQATLAPNIAVSSITVNGQINSVDNSNTINWQGAASISTLTVTGNEQVNGNLQVNGTITSANNMTANNIQLNGSVNATANITAGGIINGGTINGTTMNASAISSTGSISALNLQANNNLQVNGIINAGNSITAPNLTISNNIQGLNITGTNLLTSPSLSTTNATVSNNLNVNGILSMPNNTSLLTRLGSISSLTVSTINGQTPGTTYFLPSTLQASTITMTGRLLNPLGSISSLTVSSINGFAPGAGYTIPSTLQVSTMTVSGALTSFNVSSPMTWYGPANIDQIQSGRINVNTLSTINAAVSGNITGTNPLATLTWLGPTNFSTVTSRSVATGSINAFSQNLSTLVVSTINGVPPAKDYEIPSTISINNMTVAGTFFAGNSNALFSWSGPANFNSTVMETLVLEDLNFFVRGKLIAYPQPNRGISVLTATGMQITPNSNLDLQATAYFTQQGTVIIPSTLTVDTIQNTQGYISSLNVSSINGQSPSVGYVIPSSLFTSTVNTNGGLTISNGGLSARSGAITFGAGAVSDTGIQVNSGTASLSMWSPTSLKFGIGAANGPIVMQMGTTGTATVDMFANLTARKITASDNISTTGSVTAPLVSATNVSAGNLVSGPASIQGISVTTNNPNYVGGTITGGNFDSNTQGLYLKSGNIQLGDPLAVAPGISIQNNAVISPNATITNLTANYISTNVQILSNEANLTQLFVSTINGRRYPDDENSSVPVGTILQFAGKTLPPGGWLFCDASLVTISTYPQLFSTIGYNYTPYSFYPPANPVGPLTPPPGQFWLPDMTYAIPTTPPNPNYLVSAYITSGVWNPGAPIVPGQVWSIYYTNGRAVNVGSVFTPGLGPTTGEAPWVSTIVKNFPGGMVCVMNAGDGSLNYTWNTLTDAPGYSSTINAYNTGVTRYPQPPYTVGTYNGTGRSDQITWRNQQTNEVATHTHGYTTWADGQNTYNVSGANQSCGKQDRGTGPPSGTFTAPAGEQQNFAMPTSPNTIWMYSIIKY